MGSFWAPLGTPRDPKMQYVLCFFDVFAYSRLLTSDAQDDPKRATRGPPATPRGAQGRPTGAQDGPKTTPRRPEGSSKTAPKRPKSQPRASLMMPRPSRSGYDRNGCSKKPPRGPQEPPTPGQGLPRGPKRARTFSRLTTRGGVSSKLYIYIYIYTYIYIYV